MSVTNNGNASIVDTNIDIFTDSGCNNKVAYIHGTSGTFTGLNANTTYYVRANASNGTYRGYSGVPSSTTYQFPHVVSIGAPELTIGNNQYLGLYNPLGRNVIIVMRKDDFNGATLFRQENATTGSGYSFVPNANTLYSSIPDSSSGNCVYFCEWSGQVVNVPSGTYKVSGNNAQAPNFSNFEYKDQDGLAPQLTGKVNVNNPGVLVAGLSDCVYTVSTGNKATSSYGANLDHYDFIWPGAGGSSASYSNDSAVTGATYDGTSNVISVIAYDKRGQSRTVSKTVTLISPSYASAGLNTVRKNGIETETYLNGSISYWSGDWQGGSSRPNNLYGIYYRVNNGSYIDITSTVNSNKTSSKSGNITTLTLTSNTIKLHANGSSGGFAIGTSYKVDIFIDTGVTNSNTKYLWDNKTCVATILVTSGVFGMSRYKDNSGNYHYGINGLPKSNRALYVNGDFQAENDIYSSNITATNDVHASFMEATNMKSTNNIESKNISATNDISVKGCSLHGCVNLYDNSSGNNGTITLNQSSAEFNFLKIYFRSNDGYYSSIEVFQPHGKTLILVNGYVADGSPTSILKMHTLTISGNTITRGPCEELSVNGMSIGGHYSSQVFYITYIDGYK